MTVFITGSVWASGQRQARAQRGRKYVRLSLEHPGRMLPAIAACAIGEFTRPGDVVLDPMCGIGTSLVEAAHLGRGGIGIELEPKWASVARLNLDLATCQGAIGQGEVHTGAGVDTAERLGRSGRIQRASLLLTSPPYGAMTHGRVRSRRDGAVAVDKYAHLYGSKRRGSNLAYQGQSTLLASFTAILTACRPLLNPGAHVVITARPYRRKGHVVAFPSQVMEAAITAGLQPVARCAALMCAFRCGEVVGRTSFFQSIETARLRRSGVPAHVVQHEDVLILRNPGPEQPAGTAAEAVQ